MEDIIEEDFSEAEQVVDVVEETTSTKSRNTLAFTFTCTNCKKTVTINSDMYSKIEDKKSQHNCTIDHLPKCKIKPAE